ncbi:hypothetical protein AVEN_17101-1 [Araneus ventricosus]|uniref:Uncharacterized protein n=1 Tax=Araneus ventricosus TaxID=182803 RepID=A0A4Y2TYL9_ARAVE|nr:hypothetical protein AVEN_17101-1 [Araneus ventricosus]
MLTTLNAKPQRMTLSLDPYQTNQMIRIPAELLHRGPTEHHQCKGSPHKANMWGLWLSMKSRKKAELRQFLMESSLTCRRGGGRDQQESRRHRGGYTGRE